MNGAILAVYSFESELVDFDIIGNRAEIFLRLNRAVWWTLIPVILCEQEFEAELSPDADESGFAVEYS